MLTRIQKKQILRLIQSEAMLGSCSSCGYNRDKTACCGCMFYSKFNPQSGLLDANGAFFEKLEAIVKYKSESKK